MFHKVAFALFGLSALTLAACENVTGTQGQAMPADETDIISPDDNDDLSTSVDN